MNGSVINGSVVNVSVTVINVVCYGLVCFEWSVMNRSVLKGIQPFWAERDAVLKGDY